ncbi:MAG: hypothetical protein OIN66_05655 [Candidatus Methanoperedens sp.]|nr:hypothetical protein [Candidatus Methanoperedens sp.]
MDSERINIKLLKTIIFEIAGANGISLSGIMRNKDLEQGMISDQVIFLKNLGLLDIEFDQNEITADKAYGSGSLRLIRFKPNIETFRKITNTLDDSELSKLMVTKYYSDNLKNYCSVLLNSLKEHRLYQLPDANYLEYALKNSPSTVRFFLVDNDISALKSFHQKGIISINEKVRDKTRIELFKRCSMYFIWDNVVFKKIQEDKQNELLSDSASYFAGYLPLAERSVEKLLELIGMAEKEEKEITFPDFKLKDYLKSLLPD